MSRAQSDRRYLFSRLANLEQLLADVDQRLGELEPGDFDAGGRLLAKRKMLATKHETIAGCIRQDQKHGRYK